MSFDCDILRHDIEVLVGPLITRHLGMGQIRLRVAQPGRQPIRIHLAPHFGEFRPNIAANQFGFAGARDRERMTRRAEHLPEARLALIDQVGPLFPRGHRLGIELVGRKGFARERTEIAGKGAQFLFVQPELGHARLVFVFVAVNEHAAVAGGEGTGIFQPFINPGAADLGPEVGEVRTEHGRPFHSLQTMAADAIERDQKLAAAIEARRLRQFGAMAGSAGGLDVADGQDRLLPGERGLMRVANLRGEALATMANHASPIPHAVGNGRVGAEGLRHGSVRETWPRDALMARRAAIDHLHLRNPDLVDLRTKVSQQALGVGSRLGEADVIPLVASPGAQVVANRRDGEDNKEHHARNGEDPTQAVCDFSHLFSRHFSSRARPRTNPGP